MKILLINPTTLDNNKKPRKSKFATFPQLSLAIISALTPSQHSVETANDMVEEINFSSSYDLVGITAMTSQIDRAYQIANKFRDLGVKVLLGGVHATFMVEEAHKYVDSVVIGEVENLWEQILDDVENNNLKKTYQNEEYPDLQKLVIPKWASLNMDIYRRVPGNDIVLPIFTTRGCKFGCKFCTVTKYFGRTFRSKPIENVLKEIDSTKTNNYFFIDDNIVGDPDYARELFKAIKSRNLLWISQASTTILKTPDLIDLASDAGCTSLVFGIESINPKNLKNIRKGFNKVEEYSELFARLRQAKIRPYVSLIFGFDDDTPESFFETVDFLLKNKIESMYMWILTPLPGSDLYTEMSEQGRLLDVDDWTQYTCHRIVFKLKNLDPKTLYDTYWKAYQKFYSKKNILKHTFNAATASKNPFQIGLVKLFLNLDTTKLVQAKINPVLRY